jgi:hypothetical protein
MSSDHPKYPGVPADFPVVAVNAALPGFQLKFAAVQENGKYYQQGLSPSQVMDDYMLCEDIAQQMIRYYDKKVSEKKLNPDEILLRSYQGLIQQGWCRPEHNPWVIRRLAELVKVSVPKGIPPTI